jgi:hypothetical protein
MDLVIAATGDDASNVLACAYAAAEGEAFTVAVLHRLALLPLVRQFGIDAALSPRTASANAVLRHIRGGTASVATFLESDVEVERVRDRGRQLRRRDARRRPAPAPLGRARCGDPARRQPPDRARSHAAARRRQRGGVLPPGRARGDPQGVLSVTLASHRSGRVSWLRWPWRAVARRRGVSVDRRHHRGVSLVAVVGSASSSAWRSSTSAVDGGPDVMALAHLRGRRLGGGSVMWRVTIVPKQIRIARRVHHRHARVGRDGDRRGDPVPRHRHAHRGSTTRCSSRSRASPPRAPR